ncbi:MAG: hypothetical protein M4579_002421 [Chaenotheca gracillima]|nr:MAG: hypothetical protein M4579_002421 [Chaenotheca gracillima]
MSWFNRSLKGDHVVGTDNLDNQDSGSSSRRGFFSRSSERPIGQGDSDTYAPPSGPPPSHQFAPPPEPPPSHQFAPPPGPPPSQSYDAPPGPPPSQTFSPPPGPPPSKKSSEAPPPAYPSDSTQPYHDWTAIPDTALLPPPPSLGHEASSTSNASEVEAFRAKEWCRRNFLMQPRTFPSDALMSRLSYNYLKAPHEFKGNLSRPGRNVTKVVSNVVSSDACLYSEWPLYIRSLESPLFTERRKTVYFEVQIVSIGRAGKRGAEEASFSLGYFAAPYPTWRQPGWERGSLGVHSDDGRRYVNDSYGGKDFTSSFRAGERVGVGMTFSIPEQPSSEAPPSSGPVPQLDVEVFFTRNGQKSGGWNLHEERDAGMDLGVDGLDGMFDLNAAVGVFGAVEVDVLLNESSWSFSPES